MVPQKKHRTFSTIRAACIIQAAALQRWAMHDQLYSTAKGENCCCCRHGDPIDHQVNVTKKYCILTVLFG